jgi:hypothetical protein
MVALVPAINRLTLPLPAYHIADWLARTVPVSGHSGRQVPWLSGQDR